MRVSVRPWVKVPYYMTQMNSSLSLAGQPSSGESRWKDPAVRGALWKIASCLSFSAINGVAHYFGDAAKEAGVQCMSGPQMAFFESLFGLILVLPWLYSIGENPFKTKQYPRYILRGIVAAVGVSLWLTAMADMPIVQVIAFKYTSPFFILVGAKLFLGERIGAARALAISVTLAGAVSITVIGGDLLNENTDWKNITLMALLPIGATAFYAASAVLGKKLSKVDSPQVICFFLLLFTLPLFLVASLCIGWVHPEPWQWPYLVGMAAFLTFAYYALGNAYVAADLSYLLPLSFTRLVVGALIGVVVFAEWPNFWTWLGSFLILVASVTLCKHEVKVHQKKLKMKQKNISVAQGKLATSPT